MIDRMARRRQRLRARQADRFARMADQVHVHNPFYRAKWRAAGFDSPPTLDDLAGLPFTTKDELAVDQEANGPWGSNLTFPLDRYVRVHRTSGTTGRPLRWLDTPASWQWFLDCWLAVYEGAGVTPADRVFAAFGFGPFIGFWTAFEAAQQLGCLVQPGGHLSTDQRLQMMQDDGSTVLLSTPTYALRMLESARRLGIDLARGAVERTIHAGEPGAGVPAVKRQLVAGFGAEVFDHAGATEVGAWGIPCGVGEHLHVLEDEFIVEWIDRETGAAREPIQAAARKAGGDDLGELVLTNLGRIGSPVVRYRTGDVARLCAAGCPCGRPTVYLDGGVIARADDMFIVRGVNVYPSAVEALIREAGGVAEYRATVRRRSRMAEVEVEIEPESGQDAGSVRNRVQDLFEERLSLRVPVRIAGSGALPRFELKADRFRFEEPSSPVD
ncbi:MAG: phenylacetate--CoA ligase family protein [Acidobacteria bacterium]|nr:phenylacetate--CoA ligase family protein [Acidobacteriota bacterium]